MSTVVIDAGHGGEQPVGDPPSSPNNAIGSNGTLEKTVVLDIAQKCRDILLRQGTNVLMARNSDVNLGLYERANVARDNQAEAFVSIHLNGDDNPNIQGTETWVYTNTPTTSNSYKLAELVQQNVVAETGYRDRGIKTGGKAVLNPSQHYLNTAACLLEISFLSDPSDEARLSDDDYRMRLAEKIALGIFDYTTS